MSASLSTRAPALMLFKFDELWPRDVKLFAQDHTAEKGPSQEGALLVWV